MNKINNWIDNNREYLKRLSNWFALIILLAMFFLALNGCDTADASYKERFEREQAQRLRVEAAKDSLVNSINELYLVADSIKQISLVRAGYILILENQLATFDSVRDAQTDEMLYSIQWGVDSLVARLKDGRQQWP
jgi:hypothetical protein